MSFTPEHLLALANVYERRCGGENVTSTILRAVVDSCDVASFDKLARLLAAAHVETLCRDNVAWTPDTLANVAPLVHGVWVDNQAFLAAKAARLFGADLKDMPPQFEMDGVTMQSCRRPHLTMILPVSSERPRHKQGCLQSKPNDGGDGVDIRGALLVLATKLDALASLGLRGAWASSTCTSPQDASQRVCAEIEDVFLRDVLLLCRHEPTALECRRAAVNLRALVENVDGEDFIEKTLAAVMEASPLGRVPQINLAVLKRVAAELVDVLVEMELAPSDLNPANASVERLCRDLYKHAKDMLA